MQPQTQTTLLQPKPLLHWLKLHRLLWLLPQLRLLNSPLLRLKQTKLQTTRCLLHGLA
jgi:hypothetical protein